jgi:hypothetical protein
VGLRTILNVEGKRKISAGNRTSIFQPVACLQTDNMKTDVREAECEGIDWLKLAQASATEGYFEKCNKISLSIKSGNFFTI